jgi:rod shape-determining protein MreD
MILAVALYALLGRLEPALVILINSFSILVLFTAVNYGELDGAIMGTCAGLVQDAMSYGIFGLAGLSQTIAGFLAGWLSRKLEVNSFYKRSLFLFFLSLLQLVVWAFFYFLVFRKSLLYSSPALYFQPVFTAVLTSLLLSLLKKLSPASAR